MGDVWLYGLDLERGLHGLSGLTRILFLLRIYVHVPRVLLKHLSVAAAA